MATKTAVKAPAKKTVAKAPVKKPTPATEGITAAQDAALRATAAQDAGKTGAQINASIAASNAAAAKIGLAGERNAPGFSTAGTYVPNYGGTKVSGYSAGTAPAGVVPGSTISTSATPSDTDWLSTDPTYLAAKAAIDARSSTYNANQDALGKSYDSTYDDDLHNLGYDQSTNSFNQNDQQTESGRDYSSQMADFAARGMLGSSGYADAYDNLGRTLNTQVTNATAGKQKYHDGLNAETASNYSDLYGAGGELEQAKIAALARKQAQYATAGTAVASGVS